MQLHRSVIITLQPSLNLYSLYAWLPAALRAAQTCRYLIYSEADFEPLLRAKFHPYRCNDEGVGPTKLKFLLRFDRNMEYKRPAGAYPLRDFHKICRVYISFGMRQVLKFCWICSRGYGVWSPLPCQISPHRCNESPLRGEKPQNRPSKLNTGRLAQRAMLPVIIAYHL